MNIPSFRESGLALLIALILFLATSCGFSRLTNITNQDIKAPTATECGSCHVDQYTEWRQSSHSGAYLSEEYKKQTDNYQDEDCLFCHTPGNVFDSTREPRNFNREEGVTCVSCHLQNGAMQGPHPSEALFTPHQISESPLHDTKRNGAALCGTCHEETYDQWKAEKEKNPFPGCLECHGAEVTRSSTRGTNFFSKILVSFEPTHKVRSHKMVLSSQSGTGVYPEVKISPSAQDTLKITLINTLPHNLPAGSYGEKYLLALVGYSKQSLTSKNERIEITKINFKKTLSPGENETVTITLPEGKIDNPIEIDLFRFHQSTQSSTFIHSYIFREDLD